MPAASIVYRAFRKESSFFIVNTSRPFTSTKNFGKKLNAFFVMSATSSLVVFIMEAERLFCNERNFISCCIHNGEGLWNLHKTALHVINILLILILYRKFST